ncbi:MAG: aromatic amino acid hydroxylase [Balneolales bacterium]|nr:aromatic amino acid hydroxylase [Balneolales bacterium]
MQLTQDQVIETIPSYLRQFVVKQHYDEYNPENHATWRYIMRRNVKYLRQHAHEAYLEGLEKTGISIDDIPHINEMNERLGNIGWRAVVVDGFVPPAAFMEFSEHRILVISADLRNINNILYTPAPDIVHEAAGHAPIIADELYADYLQRFGAYGAKAVFSKLDYEIYEAIRYLSIIKEYPNATKEQIEEAEKTLEEKTNANSIPSEAALLSRLHWWTVEYGLVGTPDDYKLYGAGLLSSVGESKACMSDEVKKITLSVDCVNTDYDITKMQPQLFVARDFQHLIDVLEEFADNMCFRKGGTDSIKKVISSENVGTCVFSSGLQVSGVFTEVLTDASGNEIFLKASGPVQLSYNDTELPGHGTDYHKDGYSSPVGNIKGFGKSLDELTSDQISSLGLEEGKTVDFSFESGISVKGLCTKLHYSNNKLVLVTFENCTVKGKDGELMFSPDWGVYDMAAGSRIQSVYSGSADKEKYNVYPPKSDRTTIKDEYSKEQLQLFSLYQRIRNMREQNTFLLSEIEAIHTELSHSFKESWLPRLELLELINLHSNGNGAGLRKKLIDELNALKSHSEQYDNVITAGLENLV